jgi:outer membrane protein OmpA-like peptidoglycan-associated protein
MQRRYRALLLFLLLPLASQAQIWDDALGISLFSSAVKYLGDAPDRAALGLASGLGLKYGMSRYLQLETQLGYGSFKPSREGSRYQKDPDDMHRTFIFPWSFGARITPSRYKAVKPYLAIGTGILFWDLRYLTGEKVTFWQDHYWRWGERVSGWRKNGLLYQGLGLELYLHPALAIDLQARFSSLLNLRSDNVGQDDINSQILEGMATLIWYFHHKSDRDRDGYVDELDADPYNPEDFDGFQDLDGAPDPDNDNDGIADARDRAPLQPEDLDGYEDEDGVPDPDNDLDGIPDSEDLCANAAEDIDNFEDEDGCPDPDNDQDGIVDALDACPGKAEDIDGFEDQDGCPDIDNDGDLIVDLVDRCPDQPETINGYMDEDGCPDSDLDGDGIPDERDKCPREAETLNGFEDDDGCPDDAQITPTEKSGTAMVLQGVSFASGKAELTPESLPILDEVANTLILEPTAIVEIRGFTDNVGKAANNQLLSERRAEAVRLYLLKKGVDGERITAIGFGPRYPIADNKTPEGRASNRRIEFIRVK